MPFRPWKALAILLLLAVALPPPRVTNLLIVDAQRQESGEARKPIQARARNRISSPVRVDASQAIAPLDGGEGRPLRRFRPLAHRHAPASPSFHNAPRIATDRANLRLRC